MAIQGYPFRYRIALNQITRHEKPSQMFIPVTTKANKRIKTWTFLVGTMFNLIIAL